MCLLAYSVQYICILMTCLSLYIILNINAIHKPKQFLYIAQFPGGGYTNAGYMSQEIGQNTIMHSVCLLQTWTWVIQQYIQL